MAGHVGAFSLFGAMLLCGCAQPRLPNHAEAKGEPVPAQTFGYVFRQTTGLTSHVLLPEGREVAVQFGADSDPIALRSLRALRWNVLYPNARGERMFLVGGLHHVVRHTPSRLNMAQSEPYREFTLRDWYVVAPFEEWCEKQPFRLGEGFLIRRRTTLSRDDFDPFDGLARLNVKRFLRVRTPRRSDTAKTR